MVKSQILIIKQIYYHLENTEISKTGCRWLSKTKWKSLNTINLSKIQIIEVIIVFVWKPAFILAIVTG
jgi:hypothetical protein